MVDGLQMDGIQDTQEHVQIVDILKQQVTVLVHGKNITKHIVDNIVLSAMVMLVLNILVVRQLAHRVLFVQDVVQNMVLLLDIAIHQQHVLLQQLVQYVAQHQEVH